MLGTINTAGNAMELSEEPEPCNINWQELYGYNENKGIFQTSDFDLGNIQGNYENDQYQTYGAQFMPTLDMHTPYYERMITVQRNVPWLGQEMEKTYMNQTKVLNEPEVQTYKNIKLGSINGNNYETIENFDSPVGDNLVFKILFALFVVMVIYYLAKQIN
jgi:hypothetical protein